jgi:hypothetical protein
MTAAKLSYTIEEAAKMTGYGVTTIREHIGKGNLIAKYANKKGVIRHSDLEAWLDRLPAEAPH